MIFFRSMDGESASPLAPNGTTRGRGAQTRVDLHCHTKYSDRPSEWVLRRIGAPESFVEPIDLYNRCRERGMDFVTVSDHNRIDGALDIAHLPGTFISSEITTYFPEDDCKIHCLVAGISEAQFRVINEIRTNIYDFQQYLLQEDIIYSVAHPLFRVNDRMTVDHLEKLLVMFNRFEVINGARDPRAAEMMRTILENLTPKLIDQMANKHGLQPIGASPWRKLYTGGSDDHSGLYLGGAYTVTPHADNVEHFLSYLRAGRHSEGGDSGSSLRMAHSFYAIGYGYYRSRFLNGSKGAGDLIGELFRKVLNEQQPQPVGLRGRMWQFAGRMVRATRRSHLSPMERTIVADFARLMRQREEQKSQANGRAPSLSSDEHSFQLASQMSHLIGFSFAQRFVQQAKEGRLIESLQTVASLGPIALGIAPYLTAFAAQHKDEAFMQQVAARFEAAEHLRIKSRKKAWVTDTFDDVNGVAQTIKILGGIARQQKKDLTILTSLADEPKMPLKLRNFKPVGRFNMPEYESQAVCFPPFLDVIEHIERERYAELIISTPGPMGLTALAAAKLLGLKTTGIYHTDFPQYVRSLTEDLNMEGLAWRYMYWFFNQMDRIFVPSKFYFDQLAEYGFAVEKLEIMPRGVDTQQFNPKRRDVRFWPVRGLPRGLTFLYVGRISKEKNLETLLNAFVQLREAGHDARLAVVGDGPQLPELQRAYRRGDICFTGFLSGEALGSAFASSDVFVFPSTTDTFGNVVLEAQASGLPAIVSDKGGPQEIVVNNESGLIVDMDRPRALADAMIRFCNEDRLAQSMREASIENASDNGWEGVFECFWDSAAKQRECCRQEAVGLSSSSTV